MTKTEYCVIVVIVLLLAVLLIPAVNQTLKNVKELERIKNQTYTLTIDGEKYPHCTVTNNQFVLEDRKTILIPSKFSTVKITLED